MNCFLSFIYLQRLNKIYLMPQALQRGVPSSASLHMGVFLVQQDAQTLPSGEAKLKHILGLQYNL